MNFNIYANRKDPDQTTRQRNVIRVSVFASMFYNTQCFVGEQRKPDLIAGMNSLICVFVWTLLVPCALSGLCQWRDVFRKIQIALFCFSEKILSNN